MDLPKFDWTSLQRAADAPPWVWAGLGAVAALLIARRAQGGWARWRRERRFRRAQRAEAEAERVLEREGFTIVRDQAQHRWGVRIDGVERSFELRADFLVRRGRRRYVAEVKTGQVAPSINSAATRRQLLEYRAAYPVDGVLLVDMEAKRVHTVEFAGLDPNRRGPWSYLLTALASACAGAAATFLYLLAPHW